MKSLLLVLFKIAVAVSLLWLNGITVVSAQGNSEDPTNTLKYYYADLNTSSATEVVNIQNSLLGVKYNDQFGSPTLNLKVYNWKHQEIISFQLQKNFGLNYFNIDMASVPGGLENDKLYSCEAINEAGRKLRLLFMPVPHPEKLPPQVNILTNPVSLTCDNLSQASVEFYGQIEGGKTPYKAQWYIINNSRNSLLYQPRVDFVLTPGSTPVVFVDANPDYYVMLVVTDACGGVKKKMVHLVCASEDDNVHAVFVEPLGIGPNTVSGN